MDRIITVIKRDYAELTESAAFKWLFRLFILLSIVASVSFILIFIGINHGSVESDKEMIESFVSNTIYFFSLVPYLTFIWVFTQPIMTKEKANGNLEVLLGTPLNPAELWIGKGIVVFLPGFFLSFGTAVLTLLVCNVCSMFVDPSFGIILPFPVLVTAIISNTFFFLFLTFLIVIIAFLRNTDVAIIPSFIFGFGLMIGLPLGVATKVIDISTWNYALSFAFSTLLFCLIVVLLSLFLTKEIVVKNVKYE